MVMLTDAAVATVHRVLAGHAAATGLRIMVVDGGCAGLKYQMGLEAEADSEDTVLEYDDIRVFIDPGSLVHLSGVVVDYVESIQGAGFTFDNPNATAICACGSSFNTGCGTSSSAGDRCGPSRH